MGVLTVQETLGPYPTTPVAADSMDMTFAAMDTGGDTIAVKGGEILVFRNDNAGAQTITITSEPTAKHRLGSIENYSIGAGEFAFHGPVAVDGWKDSSGDLNVDTSSADVKIAIIRPIAASV